MGSVLSSSITVAYTIVQAVDLLALMSHYPRYMYMCLHVLICRHFISVLPVNLTQSSVTLDFKKDSRLPILSYTVCDGYKLRAASSPNV